MDFRLGEENDSFRDEVRAFLAEHLTPELVERTQRTGVSHDADFVRALRDKGWLNIDWPVELGGQGYTPLEFLPLAEEMQRAGAPLVGIVVTLLIGKVIAQVGTPELKAELLPGVFDTSLLFALGMTEPDCGSDVAAARTRATRTGEDWTINGQKIFTTNAHIADYLFLLTRTNPEARKHKGLTTFMLPMKQEGIEVQAVETLSGERTNIVFLSDVKVPDRLRLGEVDGGWSVIGLALGLEHGAGFGALSEALLDNVERWAGVNSSATRNGRSTDPDVRARLGKAATEIEVAKLLQRRVAWMQSIKRDDLAKGSMSKLFSTERLERQATDFIEMLGPDGIRVKGDPTAPVGGEVEHALRHAKGTTIYAGTSEIHRNVIAQLGLGLPRPS